MKLLLSVATMAAVAAPGLAQDPASHIPLSSRIEARTHDMIVSSIRGTVSAVDSGAVTIAVTKSGSTVRLPWSRVSAVHWATRRSHTRGLLEGALIGIIVGASVYTSNYPFGAIESALTDRQIRSAARAGIVVAAGITAIGFAVGSSRWNGAPIPGTGSGDVRLTFAPNDQVRIESTLGRIAGHNAVAGDSLRLDAGSGPIVLPWRNVGDLQIRAGRNRVLGVLYGAAIAFAASGLAESFTDVSKEGFATNVAVGMAFGYRYLTPKGWTSLPIPR